MTAASLLHAQRGFQDMQDDIDKWIAEEAARRLAEAERDEADPISLAKIAAKRKAEFEHGIREGWWDKDGNSLLEKEEDENEEEE